MKTKITLFATIAMLVVGTSAVAVVERQGQLGATKDYAQVEMFATRIEALSPRLVPLNRPL